MENFRLLIVTGMSGAGKSRVLQSLEDMGYFCMDNLPPILIPKFAELCFQGGERVSHVAMVVDSRGGEFFNALAEALSTLEDMHVDYDIVFMEASDKVLINRFKECRRAHPLAVNGRITQGLTKERKLLSNIRKKADYIIDTSSMSTKELKSLLKKHFVQKTLSSRMTVTVVSFGFKFGIPVDADMIWDVRFLPNPFYLEELRRKTGRVPQVAEYIESFDVTKTFKAKYLDIMGFLIPQYEKEGKSQFVVGVGCTGGMHRSVCMAEALGEFLKKEGHRVAIEHRDLYKNEVEEDCTGNERATKIIGGKGE